MQLGQLGGPQEMMLVSTDANWPNEKRSIFSLPDERFLALFDGFDGMPEEALPKSVNLLGQIEHGSARAMAGTLFTSTSIRPH
jgi:hypothetical protein